MSCVHASPYFSFLLLGVLFIVPCQSHLFFGSTLSATSCFVVKRPFLLLDFFAPLTWLVSFWRSNAVVGGGAYQTPNDHGGTSIE